MTRDPSSPGALQKLRQEIREYVTLWDVWLPKAGLPVTMMQFMGRPDTTFGLEAFWRLLVRQDAGDQARLVTRAPFRPLWVIEFQFGDNPYVYTRTGRNRRSRKC